MVNGSRTVLLVEDDRFLRKAAEASLRRHGYRVVVAGDGEQALAMARAETPALILLDLILPKIQGFEVLRRLKADLATARIPVIVLSNLGLDDDVREAIAAGAESYYVKLSTPLAQLVTLVRAALDGEHRKKDPCQE